MTPLPGQLGGLNGLFATKVAHTAPAHLRGTAFGLSRRQALESREHVADGEPLFLRQHRSPDAVPIDAQAILRSEVDDGPGAVVLALEARVAWRDGHRYGCAFVHPLHPAVFDHIVALSEG